MKRWYVVIIALALGACAGGGKSLTVKQFFLRDEADGSSDEPMIRGEKKRILYGAVSLAERKERLGQYYTVLWKDPEGADQGEVEVRYEFQQGGSASKIKRRSQTFASSARAGKAEFSVIGDDYFKGGKVLAWKVSLLRGGRVLESKQSYLWN